MRNVLVEKTGRVARVVLSRGKVNALNPDAVADLRASFEELKRDQSVRAIVLTGDGPFFSFGFDVPEFLNYGREDFTRYLHAFTSLYSELYDHPKPIIASVNGHAVAGGCMIAIACDYRLMISGKAKIGLNEVSFGSSVFAGSVEILRHLTGQRNAERIALSGGLLSAEQARGLGLVDEVCSSAELAAGETRAAERFARLDTAAFASVKRLFREPIAERIRDTEDDSIREFVDIWYSASTRKQLELISIRGESS